MNRCSAHPYIPVPSRAPCPLCAAAPIIRADQIAAAWDSGQVDAASFDQLSMGMSDDLEAAIAEGRAVSDIVRKKGGMFQIGSQQRSGSQFRMACEMVRSGRIGKVHTIVTQLGEFGPPTRATSRRSPAGTGTSAPSRPSNTPSSAARSDRADGPGGDQRGEEGHEGDDPGVVDAKAGEELILLNHVSHDVATPYRSTYAIYVRKAAERSAQFVDETPPVFEGRPMAFRAFDAAGMLRNAALALPGQADEKIRALFAQDEIAYIHAHNAAHGCFSARIERV